MNTSAKLVGLAESLKVLRVIADKGLPRHRRQLVRWLTQCAESAAGLAAEVRIIEAESGVGEVERLVDTFGAGPVRVVETASRKDG